VKNKKIQKKTNNNLFFILSASSIFQEAIFLSRAAFWMNNEALCSPNHADRPFFQKSVRSDILQQYVCGLQE
jgi:hypothetical protein